LTVEKSRFATMERSNICCCKASNLGPWKRRIFADRKEGFFDRSNNSISGLGKCWFLTMEVRHSEYGRMMQTTHHSERLSITTTKNWIRATKGFLKLLAKASGDNKRVSSKTKTSVWSKYEAKTRTCEYYVNNLVIGTAACNYYVRGRLPGRSRAIQKAFFIPEYLDTQRINSEAQKPYIMFH
jgi:hypothetical protein